MIMSKRTKKNQNEQISKNHFFMKMISTEAEKTLVLNKTVIKTGSRFIVNRMEHSVTETKLQN